jgi:hypothetical protein
MVVVMMGCQMCIAAFQGADRGDPGRIAAGRGRQVYHRPWMQPGCRDEGVTVSGSGRCEGACAGGA